MSAQFTLSRRDLLLSLPALTVARKVFAQAGSTLKIRAFNHMTIAVSDPKRTVDFYQTLFGMPIQARQGPIAILRVGSGPQFLAVSGLGAATTPSINHYCVTVEDFSVDRVLKVLADHGVTKAEGAAGGLGGGPLKVRVRMRGPEAGGAAEGTPEIYVGDPAGVVIQLQHTKYAGGAGVLGDVIKVEPSPSKGVIALEDYSHFTLFEPDAARSNKFFQDLFGMGIQAYQGTLAALAIGPDAQFLAIAGGGGGGRGGAAAAPVPASINHVSFTMKNFNVAAVQKALESVGIKPRTGTGPVGPMQHYVTMRMEDRGGAKEGTPELYFTDPDGILVQIQDVSYCGGGGYLGNVCPPL